MSEDGKKLNGDLIRAIKTGEMVAFKEALRGGASPGACDQYRNPALILAVEREQHEMILQLLAAGADINARSQMFSHSALHAAARSDSMETTELLLKNGADVNAWSRRHATPLGTACKAGKLAQVRILLDHGARAEGNEKDDSPPVMAALFARHWEVAGLLLSRFPELFRNCDGKGLSLLGRFAYWKNHAIVAWLLNQPMPDRIKDDPAYFRNAAAEAAMELDDYEQFEGYETARAATIEAFRKHGDI